MIAFRKYKSQGLKLKPGDGRMHTSLFLTFYWFRGGREIVHICLIVFLFIFFRNSHKGSNNKGYYKGSSFMAVFASRGKLFSRGSNDLGPLNETLATDLVITLHSCRLMLLF